MTNPVKAALLGCAASLAFATFATTHYVSPTGAGEKDGSSPENARSWSRTNGDWQLLRSVGGARNPCLEGGVPLDWMTEGCLDLAGNPRIRDGATRPDLGCYEFTPESSFMIFLR